MNSKIHKQKEWEQLMTFLVMTKQYVKKTNFILFSTLIVCHYQKIILKRRKESDMMVYHIQNDKSFGYETKETLE